MGAPRRLAKLIYDDTGVFKPGTGEWMVLRPAPEERINTWTHAFGFLLSVVGAVVLLAAVLGHSDRWRALGCGMYSVALVGVYCCSTLSHSACQADWKRRFRCLDQAFIYLLIVGTYTPFALAYLRTPWWIAFLTLMWGIAVIGFFSKIWAAHRVDSVAIWIYLALGWMPLIAGIRLIGDIPAAALLSMLGGGLCYSIGTIFLFLDGRVPHFHAVWHLCVIAGSVIHFYAIFMFVARAGI